MNGTVFSADMVVYENIVGTVIGAIVIHRKNPGPQQYVASGAVRGHGHHRASADGQWREHHRQVELAGHLLTGAASMNDPLGEDALFKQVATLLNGVSTEIACVLAVNLLVNAIRQSVPYRKDAEAVIDELIGRAKTVLLDKHYDSVTGQRRSVFPFTQVIEAPFHVEQDKIFHG